MTCYDDGHRRCEVGPSHAPVILVGGYPFLLSPDLWRRVGADGFASDAQQAVQVANALADARRMDGARDDAQSGARD